jgi:hypothetical protein
VVKIENQQDKFVLSDVMSTRELLKENYPLSSRPKNTEYYNVFRRLGQGRGAIGDASAYFPPPRDHPSLVLHKCT